MAGGKETPRQKMIGLMYLVLLAMLALNVSADIMNKFLQVNNSLTGFVDESKAKSNDVISNITEKVKERGSKKEEVEALKQAKSLHTKSTDLLTWITDVKNELVLKTGGTKENGENSTEGTPIGMKDNDVTSTLLIGQGDQNDGKAYTLKEKLDAHIDYLNKVAKSVAIAIDKKNPKPLTFPKIALNGDQDPLFANEGPDIRSRDFAHLNFDHTPMVAATAFLTEKQAKIAAYEAQILEQMKGLVGAADFKFDGVVGMFRAKSETVVAGRKYEAEMFVSATSSTMAAPTMTSTAGKVTMDGSTGKISFVASAGKESVTKKSWTGSIKMQKPDGSDTTLTVKADYFVARPVLKVSAGDIAALYLNCANKLSVSCPALGAEFDPSYVVSGGRVKKSGKAGEITVYPNAKQVVMTVKSGGQSVGTEKFKVKKVPLPTVEIRPDGKKMTPAMVKKGMSPPRNISIRVIAESGFASALPSESKYRATAWSVQLARGRRPVGGAKKFSGTSGSVADLKGKVNGEGYRMIVEVTGVARKKSSGGTEPIREFRTNSVIQTLSF